MKNLPITKSSFRSVYGTILAIFVMLIVGIFAITRGIIAPSLVKDRINGIQSIIRSHDYDILLNNTRALRDELIQSKIIASDLAFDHFLPGDITGHEKELFKNCKNISDQVCINGKEALFRNGDARQYKYAVILKGDFLKTPASLYALESLIFLLISISMAFLVASISRKENLLSKKLSLASQSVNDVKKLFSEEINPLESADEFQAISQSVDELGKSLQKATIQIKEYKENFARKTRLEQLGLTVGQVSHDLKAPFNEMENFLESLPLLIAKVSPEDIVKSTSTLLARVRDGRQSLQDALQFTKRMANLKDQIFIGEVIHTVSERAQRNNKLKNITINADFSDDFKTLGNKARLETALLNLLENTAEEKPNAIVSIFLSRESSGYARLLYKDNGSGIPEDRLANIFEPLVSFKAGGTGLGLSSTKEIIGQHGGKINALPSISGAKFEILLPILTVGGAHA